MHSFRRSLCFFCCLHFSGSFTCVKQIHDINAQNLSFNLLYCLPLLELNDTITETVENRWMECNAYTFCYKRSNNAQFTPAMLILRTLFSGYFIDFQKEMKGSVYRLHKKEASLDTDLVWTISCIYIGVPHQSKKSNSC